jgi:hypothetical protein
MVSIFLTTKHIKKQHNRKQATHENGEIPANADITLILRFGSKVEK